MADNKTPMGDDPLAWLTEGDELNNSQPKQVAQTRSRTRRQSSGRKVQKEKTDVELLQDSFAALAPQGDALAARFYQRLFEHYPAVIPLFSGSSMAEQQKKLLAALVLLVHNLNKPDVLSEYLKGLGARHAHYGVIADHYPLVAENLLAVMEEFAGDLWTVAVKLAWENTLNTIATIMLEAYEPVEADEMITNNQELVVDNEKSIDFEGQLAAISKVMGVISFDMDGTIIDINQNFLDVVGYTRDEVINKHHRMFAEPSLATSPEYTEFWAKLNRGENDAGEYKRLAKGGQEVWLQASYNPILDMNGKPFKVVKYATDITKDKLKNADSAGQLQAIDKAMGVISFDMDGTIIDINQNFLDVVGYTRDEVINKHHRMFAEPSLAASAEYTEFWAKLNRGENDTGEYKRLAKGGQEVWLQASYNPILDMNGKPFKVVKYATDITKEKLKNADSAGQLEAIDKAMGIISFNMDGTIIDINQNFLDVVGYSKEQVVGNHHRMFAEAELANSAEYREFWAKLNRGEYDAGEYKRIAKGGKEVWLQASYNPILDLNGKPYKVVKYASDITANKVLQMTVDKVMMDTSIVMSALSNGDLTQVLEGVYEGEFAMLQTAINQTVTKLAQTVNEINETASSIAMAASEISEGNIDLSQRTEEQASSLEETASSMEELTSTVRQNSDNARQANQLASTAREQAEKGGAVIKSAISAMTAISASSKKVTDIIGVIDEIAFQTNLLALNAAVEAARAGEQGRGFAVVASEVRNLAQRSASAAKEIKELINDSGEKVKEGSMLVDESGRTLEEIVIGAKKVGDIISEIAAAGAEQTQGIEQVNKAVTQMDEMTQQNAALVEQAAAASESLEEQGKGLQRLMTFFNTGVDSAEPTAKKIVAAKKMSTEPRAKVAPKARVLSPKSSGDDEWDEF